MSLGLDDRVFEHAADLFSLLWPPTRLRIVCALMEGERNLTELIERVPVSQPNMSQHLAALYRGGILGRRRTGSQIFYRVERTGLRVVPGASLRYRALTCGRIGAPPHDAFDLSHSSQEPQ